MKGRLKSFWTKNKHHIRFLNIVWLVFVTLVFVTILIPVDTEFYIAIMYMGILVLTSEINDVRTDTVQKQKTIDSLVDILDRQNDAFNENHKNWREIARTQHGHSKDMLGVYQETFDAFDEYMKTIEGVRHEH